MTLRYSRGSNIRDNRPIQRTVAGFSEFLSALDEDRAPKKASAAYICGPLNGDGRRCRDGALPREWLPVDLDRVEATMQTDVEHWFASYSGCMWPTHSSTTTAPRLRIIIELARPASREECVQTGALLKGKLLDAFGESVYLDESVFRPEQPILVPPVGASMKRLTGEPMQIELTNSRPCPTEEGRSTPEELIGHPQSSSVPLLSSSVEIPPDSIPKNHGERNQCLFRLARIVKAKQPNATRDQLREIASSWHKLALPFIESKDFALTFADFARGFKSVRDPFESVIGKALADIDISKLQNGV